MNLRKEMAIKIAYYYDRNTTGTADGKARHERKVPMIARKKRLDEEALQEIIRRVVEVAKPEKIILFGSAARGEMGPHSDVDLLVVKKGKCDRSRLVGGIYMRLHGVGQAVDVIVVTPKEVERYRNTHCL